MSPTKKAEPITTTDILSSYRQDVVKGIKMCVDANESILLIGETGTGKSTLMEELAKQQGKELHRVSVNGSMGIEEILGKWLAKDGSTYWIDGILTKAVRKGDWVIFDEINAMLPEMGFALHSLLDDARKLTLAEKDGEVIKAHPEFRFSAGMNPGDEYAGTKEVNMALKSRFGGVFHIDVFSTIQELEVLKRHGVDQGHATKLVNLANQLRSMRSKGDLFTFVSTRDIIQAGKLATQGLELPLAVEFAILNKMTQEEKEDLAKTSIMKDYITAGVLFKSPEIVEMEKKLEKAVKDKADYERAYKEETVKRATAQKELDKIRGKGGAGNISIGDIDPKQIELLKKLGIIKSK